MKRQAIAYMATAASLCSIFSAASPCQGQLLKQLEQGLLGGQGQGQQQGLMPGQQGGGMYGQQGGGNVWSAGRGNVGGQQGGGMFGQQAGATLVGNVNLPQGQYVMTNMQTSQAFYVTVQNGQMFLTSQPGAPQASGARANDAAATRRHGCTGRIGQAPQERVTATASATANTQSVTLVTSSSLFDEFTLSKHNKPFKVTGKTMLQESKPQEEWYRRAIRVLQSAVSDNAGQLEQGEVPPTEESIKAASACLNELSEQLSKVAPPKISISSDGTIFLRWKVSDGRIDVSFRGDSMRAFIST